LAKTGKSEITPQYLFPDTEFSDDEGDGGCTFALSGIDAYASESPEEKCADEKSE